MNNVKDVSLWKRQNDWTTGTREKKWLLYNDEVKYLFKEPKSFGEIYAEVAAYRIGTIIYKLTIPETYIAKRNDDYGVISRNFIDIQQNDTFAESVDFFPEGFDKFNLFDYKIEDALVFVGKYGLLEDFFTMCIFDYMIANQDRHSENWGLIFKENEEVCFAPLYDNGSSLLNGYNEAKIQLMIKDTNMFQAFTKRAESIFSIEGKRRTKCVYLLEKLIEYDKMLFIKSFSRFSEHSYDVLLETLDDIDTFFMTKDRKQLVVQLILYREKVINDLITKSLGGDHHDK